MRKLTPNKKNCVEGTVGCILLRGRSKEILKSESSEKQEYISLPL